MNIRWSMLVVACCACLGVGLAAQPQPQTKLKTVTVRVPPVTRVVERVKLKYVNLAKQPSGYISADQCSTIVTGTSLRDLLFLYGWPAQDDGDSYAGGLDYPLAENHAKLCVVDFLSSHVTAVHVDPYIS